MVSIAFTGGGTGGHIYPGLAVAAQLKGRCRIFWIGSSAGMDRSIIEEAGIEFFGVPSGKLRRYFSLRTVVDCFKIIAGFFAAKRILKKQKPCVLFSKGGFVSVPPCAAAASLKIPVFTHESDFSPGLATKLNSRFVLKTRGKIFTAYEDTAKFFPQAIRSLVLVSGNPVRAVFRHSRSNSDAAEKGRAFLNVDKDARILLVLGGSQGARQINNLIREALSELTQIYTVVHQTGPNLEWDVPESERYKPFPFIKEELPFVMAVAELMLGRSGAGIWEWATLGKPMVLIPLMGSGTRGDQVENAAWFKKRGAALVLLKDDVDSKTLVKTVDSLAHNEQARMSMANASLKIAECDSAQYIADVLLGGATL